MFDTVVAEGMKYKRKCKALKSALLEFETRALGEKSALLCQFEEARTHYDRAMAEAQAQFVIELAQCRDQKRDEWQAVVGDNEALRERLRDCEAALREREIETETLRERLRESEREHAEGLAEREKEFVSARDSAEREWRERETALLSDCERERQRLAESVAERETLREHCDALTRRLEAHALGCQDCAAHRATIAELEIIREELSYERQRLRDESAYYCEENARLDKQHSLMKSELERLRGSAGSPDFRNLLKSERENSK